MKNCNKNINKFLLLSIACIFFAVNCPVSADDFGIEKVIYSEDYEEQRTVDEELFTGSEEYEEYEEYVVYTDNDTIEEENAIVLEPSNNQTSKPLKAVVEKNYTHNTIEAYNTYWDNSDNFRTLYLSNPSMMLKMVPSVIHAAQYKFQTDENTTVHWGHAALSSQDGISVGFVGKLESDYDSGLKINTKLGKVNVSSAIYESLETHNPSGGVVISTDEIAFKNIKGTFRFGGGFYSNQNTDEKDSIQARGLFSKYNLGRFTLGAQIGENQYNKSQGKYGTSLYLYPELQLTQSLSLTSKFASHFDQKYSQKVIGLTYKPFKNNPNDFSLNVKATLYEGEGTKDKQRFELSTKFRL